MPSEKYEHVVETCFNYCNQTRSNYLIEINDMHYNEIQIQSKGYIYLFVFYSTLVLKIKNV